MYGHGILFLLNYSVELSFELCAFERRRSIEFVKWEGNTHFVVLDLAYLFEGQHLYLVYAVVRSDELFQKFGIIRVVVERRNDYLAQSRGDALLLEHGEKGEGRFDRAAHVLAVESVGVVLDIEQDSVGDRQECFGLLSEDTARRVEAGVESRIAAEREELTGKLCLHQRLASRQRDAALFTKVGAVSQRPFCELFCRVLITALGTPRVGIVTATATQVASLGENYKPDARTV